MYINFMKITVKIFNTGLDLKKKTVLAKINIIRYLVEYFIYIFVQKITLGLTSIPI